MIKAMDILHTAEKIMGSGKNLNPTQPDFISPGTFVTADIPGSGKRLYKVLSITGHDVAKVKNVETKKIYIIPLENLSAVLISDPFDDDSIKVYDKDFDPYKDNDDNKVDQIGVKKPDNELGDKIKSNGDKAGVYILGGKTPYSISRYDKSGQFSRQNSLLMRKYDR